MVYIKHFFTKEVVMPEYDSLVVLRAFMSAVRTGKILKQDCSDKGNSLMPLLLAQISRVTGHFDLPENKGHSFDGIMTVSANKLKLSIIHFIKSGFNDDTPLRFCLYPKVEGWQFNQDCSSFFYFKCLYAQIESFFDGNFKNNFRVPTSITDFVDNMIIFKTNESKPTEVQPPDSNKYVTLRNFISSVRGDLYSTIKKLEEASEVNSHDLVEILENDIDSLYAANALCVWVLRHRDNFL